MNLSAILKQLKAGHGSYVGVSVISQYNSYDNAFTMRRGIIQYELHTLRKDLLDFTAINFFYMGNKIKASDLKLRILFEPISDIKIITNTRSFSNSITIDCDDKTKRRQCEDMSPNYLIGFKMNNNLDGCLGNILEQIDDDIKRVEKEVVSNLILNKYPGVTSNASKFTIY